MNVDAIVRHALVSHFLLLDRTAKKSNSRATAPAKWDDDRLS